MLKFRNIYLKSLSGTNKNFINIFLLGKKTTSSDYYSTPNFPKFYPVAKVQF